SPHDSYSNVLSTPASYPLPLHDALPIFGTSRPRDSSSRQCSPASRAAETRRRERAGIEALRFAVHDQVGGDRPERAARLDAATRSEEHTSELQSPYDLVCRLLLEKKKTL